jgi:hypothetical protein
MQKDNSNAEKPGAPLFFPGGGNGDGEHDNDNG